MVKVLVATTEAQGSRPSDIAAAVEGELVYVPAVGCLHQPEDVSACAAGVCECELAFVGMASNRSTTTALVVERPDLRESDLWTALSDTLERQGRLGPEASAEETKAFRLLFRRTLATASHFRTGSVLERDGDHIHRRALTEPLSIPFDMIGDS